jgi:hypothetical protein
MRAAARAAWPALLVAAGACLMQVLPARGRARAGVRAAPRSFPCAHAAPAPLDSR